MVACAYEACRIIDAHGMLRNAIHGMVFIYSFITFQVIACSFSLVLKGIDDNDHNFALYPIKQKVKDQNVQRDWQTTIIMTVMRTHFLTELVQVGLQFAVFLFMFFLLNFKLVSFFLNFVILSHFTYCKADRI